VTKTKTTIKVISPKVLSKYSRVVNPEARVVCPVVQHILHGQVVRCIVAITESARVQVSIPLTVFNALPVKEVEI
jgi:hypothetical protein